MDFEILDDASSRVRKNLALWTEAIQRGYSLVNPDIQHYSVVLLQCALCAFALA